MTTSPAGACRPIRGYTAGMQPYQTHRMRWSWPLFRLAGIDVSVHLTFFLLLAWIGLGVWRQTGNTDAVLQGIAFVLTLFSCVVMHEFGHALTARRFGIQTRGITLLPIGGVASLERMPDDPKQEILVALAGPAVNIAIAGLLFLMLGAEGPDMQALDKNPAILFTSAHAFAYNVMVVNIILAVFNLLPAFPMDGGRVLRAALALAMPHLQATRAAAAIGQMLAMGMFLLGLLYNPILMLVSAFIWLGAAGEAGAEALSHALHKVPVTAVMRTDFELLQGQQSLRHAADLAVHHGHRHFAVALGDDRPHLLTQDMLLAALREHPESTQLASLRLPHLPLVNSTDSAERLLQSLQSSQNDVAGVMRAGHLVGLVTLNGLLQWVQFREATRAD